MTEVIATEANKRDLTNCFDHIDGSGQTDMRRVLRSPPPLSPNASCLRAQVGINQNAETARDGFALRTNLGTSRRLRASVEAAGCALGVYADRKGF